MATRFAPIAALMLGALLACSSEDGAATSGAGASGAGASGAGAAGPGGSGASGGGGSGAAGAGGAGAGGANASYRCGDPRLPMATPSFADPIEIQPGQGTGGTAVGDLDGDGRDEVVAQILFKIYDLDGGTWTAHPVLDDLNGRGNRFAGDIEIADMNGDGMNDIVVPDSDNAGTQGAISWFENPGQLDGNWVEHAVTTFSGNGDEDTVAHLSELEVGDLDGNGWADIVVRDISHGVWVLMNQGGADDWAPRRYIPTLPREGLRLWDPDGDGTLDLLLNGVWIETPDDPMSGDFILHPIVGMEDWYAPDGSNDSVRDYACKVDVADFDGDGKVDVVVTNAEELNASSPTKPHGIAIYLQPDDPVNDTWTEIILTDQHFSWHTLMIADFDFDGTPDVLTAISAVGQDDAGDQITLWLNDGDGTSFSGQSLASAATVYQGIIGDVDDDGDCDLVAPDHFDAGPIRLYENTTAP